MFYPWASAFNFSKNQYVGTIVVVSSCLAAALWLLFVHLFVVIVPQSIAVPLAEIIYSNWHVRRRLLWWHADDDSSSGKLFWQNFRQHRICLSLLIVSHCVAAALRLASIVLHWQLLGTLADAGMTIWMELISVWHVEWELNWIEWQRRRIGSVDVGPYQHMSYILESDVSKSVSQSVLSGRK